MIHNDGARQLWSLERVIKLKPGIDGAVRVAKLKTSSGETTRDISLLYPLESGPEPEIVPCENTITNLPHLHNTTEQPSNENADNIAEMVPVPGTSTETHSRPKRKTAKKARKLLRQKISDGDL